MSEKRFNLLKIILLLLIISAVLVYIILRANYLSFTHDECISFKLISGDNTYINTPNDHLLNTLLMKICNRIFGSQEIILRLPNIIAFVIYSFFVFKIMVKASNILIMLVGVSLLLLNPYMIDYFSLARGYGLALGFGLAAVFYLLKYERFSTYKNFVNCLSLALLFSLLSAYSHLTFTNFNISLVVIFGFEFYILLKSNKYKISKKEISLVLFVFLVNLFFLCLLINKLIILKNNGNFYYGGKISFIDDTLTILIHRSIYYSYYGELFWIRLRQIIIAVFAITLVYQLFIKKYSSLSKITQLLLIMIFAIILQHFTFNVLYPIDRYSIIFIPLFGLFVYFLIIEIQLELISKKYFKIAFQVLLFLVVCIPLSWHFVKNVNLKYTKEWKQDANTKSIMKTIIEQHKSYTDKKTITFSNTWFFEPSINYYRTLYKMDYLQPANRDTINKQTDYIYCTFEEKSKLNIDESYITVLQYNDTESVLLRKR